VLAVTAGYYLIEQANPRHEHEWRLFEEVALPEGSVLVPGVVTHHTNVVEHPELVADRLVRVAQLVGREHVMGGTDCGFAQARSRNGCTRRSSGRSCARWSRVPRSPPTDSGPAADPADGGAVKISRTALEGVGVSALDRRDLSRSRRTQLAALAAALALTVAAVPAAAMSVRATKLTTAEQVFVKQYKRLIPALDKASAAVVTAVNDSSKFSNAQVVSVFTAVAKQWASATKPLLALAVPPQVSSIFRRSPAMCRRSRPTCWRRPTAGRTQNGSAAKVAGRELALNFNALDAAVAKLKLKLKLP